MERGLPPTDGAESATRPRAAGVSAGPVTGVRSKRTDSGDRPSTRAVGDAPPVRAVRGLGERHRLTTQPTVIRGPLHRIPSSGAAPGADRTGSSEVTGSAVTTPLARVAAATRSATRAPGAREAAAAGLYSTGTCSTGSVSPDTRLAGPASGSTSAGTHEAPRGDARSGHAAALPRTSGASSSPRASGSPRAARGSRGGFRGGSRLRVSPLGRGLAVAVAVLLAGAHLLRYPELAVLGGAGAAAIGLAVLAVARRPRVVLDVGVSSPHVVRGEPATVVLTLRNLSRWAAPPFTVRLSQRGPAPARVDQAGQAASGHDPAAGDRSFGLVLPILTVSVEVTRLPGGGRRDIEMPVDTSRRGVVQLGPAEVTRADPFGLAGRRQRLEARDVLYIRPRARPLAALPAVPFRDPDGRTGHGSTGGLEVHTLRPYAPGEALRLVHWPSSARAGTLMVRTHVDPAEPAATVVLDVRAAAYPDGRIGAFTFEDAADIAAAAVLACASESFGVRLVTTAGLRVTARRRRDIDVLLDELAIVRRDPTASLDVIATLRRGGLGTLVVVTGGLDRGVLPAVTPIAPAYGRVVVVRVGPRSAAAARALDRRDASGRAHLRPSPPWPVPPVRASGARLFVRSSAYTVGEMTDAQGATPAGAVGRLTVIDVPTAATLPDRWPVPGLDGASAEHRATGPDR